MLQDLIRIKPQSRKNYYPARYEFATPVTNPRNKAWHFFQWALIFHARKKPAEAYKYYEKAIQHHKRPVYLRQMALLHHEMGYLRDALLYMRSALDIEKSEYLKKLRQEKQQREHARSYSAPCFFSYTETPSRPISAGFTTDHSVAFGRVKENVLP